MARFHQHAEGIPVMNFSTVLATQTQGSYNSPYWSMSDSRTNVALIFVKWADNDACHTWPAR